MGSSDREDWITAGEGEISGIPVDWLGGSVEVGAMLAVGLDAKKLDVLSMIWAYLPSMLVPITFDW